MAHLVTPERRKHFAEIAPPQPQKGPARGVPEATPGRFCFTIHYTEDDDVLRSDPSFAHFSDEERTAWLDWVKHVGPGFAWPVKGGASRTGATAEGMIISVPLLPRDMVGKGRRAARETVIAASDMAVEYGASRLGLGAFTSIVTNGGAAVSGRGVPVTSGNTLTTVSAVTALQRAAERADIDTARAHVVIVGATGAVGRLVSLMAARWAGRLTLVGNDKNPHAPRMLERVANEVVQTLADEFLPHWAGELSATVRDLLPHNAIDIDTVGIEDLTQVCQRANLPTPLAATTDLEQALETADIVLVATNADITLVDPNKMRPGTVVCDVAKPANVAPTDLSESGVLVFDGGLVKPPFPVQLGPFQNLPDGLCWGCLGETILLALEGETKDYSIGRDLSLKDADRMAEMAQRHGFEPAEPQWRGDYLEDADFKRVAEARRKLGLTQRAGAYHYNIAAE